jgi:hypothetical protein
MSEQHPADEMVEALLGFDAARASSTHYVAGYLNSVLRQIMDRLPEEQRGMADRICQQSTQFIRKAQKNLQQHKLSPPKSTPPPGTSKG